MALELVNRAERIRGKAWKQAQSGELERYWRLVNLGLEAHHIRDVGETVRHVREG